MRYKVGESIVHPSHGVGRIIGLETQTFLGNEAKLFYEVLTSKSTIWVSTEGDQAAALRSVTSKADLARYRRLLQSPPAQLDPDHRKRQLEMAGRLRDGTFSVLCEIVRDLTARGRIKPLNEADSAALRRARSSLLQEWAAAAEVTLAEATAEVDELLQAGNHAA
ncbi:MAG: CarD family transcriptional regulator [Anaerolineales bacterium]